MRLAGFIFLLAVCVNFMFFPLYFRDFNLLENNLPDMLSKVSYSEFAYCFLRIRLVWGIFEKNTAGMKDLSLHCIRGCYEAHRISHMMLSWLSWYLGASFHSKFPFLSLFILYSFNVSC